MTGGYASRHVLMIYLALIAVFLLLLINLRASVLVLGSEFNSRSQKFMQLALVWLLPFIGAVLTTQFHKGISRNHSPGQPWGDGRFDEAWALQDDNHTHEDHVWPSNES